MSILKIWTFFQKSFKSHHRLGEVFPFYMAKSNTLNPSIYMAIGRLMLLSANVVKQWKDFSPSSNTNQAEGESEN